MSGARCTLDLPARLSRTNSATLLSFCCAQLVSSNTDRIGAVSAKAAAAGDPEGRVADGPIGQRMRPKLRCCDSQNQKRPRMPRMPGGEREGRDRARRGPPSTSKSENSEKGLEPKGDR